MASKQETANQTYETAAPAAPTGVSAAKAPAPKAPVMDAKPSVAAPLAPKASAKPASAETSKAAKPVAVPPAAKAAKSPASKPVTKAAKRRTTPTPKTTPTHNNKTNKTTIRAAAAKPIFQAASVSKGQLNMKDMVTKFAEQAKANAEAFSAEFGARAQDAMTKGSKLAEEATAFNKSNVEAVVESGKIAVKNLETLRDESISFARKSFEDSSHAFKSLTSVTSPAEFFKLYAENSKKAFDAAAAQASKNSELLVKMTSDSFAPISNRMAVISSQLKVA
jgi:phasin family protein